MATKLVPSPWEKGEEAGDGQMRCAVCALRCMYHYYNVRSCEGCKQFFRRSIVMQKEFVCKRDGSCAVTKGEKCQSCRLDRCLLAGMDPKLFENGSAERMKFMAKLGERRTKAAKRLETDKMVEEVKAEESQKMDRPQQTSMVASQCLVGNMMGNLVDLERRQRRIWASRTELPSAYFDRFGSLEELLKDAGNVLSIAHNFSQEDLPIPLDKAKLLERVDEFGLNIDEITKMIVIDRFLSIEMAKALTVFRRLDLKDQLLLLQNIAVPLNIFCNAFYSAAMGSDTWIRTNGLMSMAVILHATKFRGDKRVAYLGRKQFCESVQAVKRVGLRDDEFAMVLGMFYNNPNAFGLSTAAKDLLYDESVRHAKALLQLLQLRYGQLAGASKFAESIGLVELMFKLENNYQSLSVYLDLFYANKRVDMHTVFPRALFPVVAPLS